MEEDYDEELDKQAENKEQMRQHDALETEKLKNKVAPILPYQWKKGQSGNIMGRPKGKTMKDYARQYLERLTDDERDEWLEGLDKRVVWEMSEGKAKQDVEVSGELVSKVISVDE